ncbi:unnamed protein product [Microthlaspi erraticum]|uniref:SKP1 component POZ domain-containing protein n=1 Tax=Microthlaspi erraticum TaxID=1685480 RepID=A0A6D2KKL6_9BRAS|nr:unnamed protein product [Microthlaspi erraticum]
MSTPAKKIVLKSSDGETFEVEEAVALQSQTISHMVEDDCVENGVPLANVTSNILVKVIEYCRKHVPVIPDGDGASPSSSEEELKTWDAKFIEEIDQSTLFHLILAANFLNIKGLLDLTCQPIPSKERLQRRFVLFSTSRTISHRRRKQRFAEKTSGLLNDHVHH